ncbi:site-specific integrase [Streptomyces sp. IBSBF 2394]|uniref:site-specific integrase n=1 Tax=Streptomyces sp. IBSBF 2394 TaxID=2903532 RepID=UPI002FDBFAC3
MTWDPTSLSPPSRNGIPVPSRSWTLGEWLGYWLEHIVAPEREHNTYVKYESKVRLYLLPHLGKKPLVKLTPAQIRAFMATLTREKVGASARFEVLRLRGRPLHPGQAGAARQGRRRLVLKDLKTESSQAVLPLPEFCARVLDERRELQALERKIAGAHWSQEPDHDLIFSSEHGGVIDPVGFSRTFDRLVKRVSVRRITVRLARHTCGTLPAFLKVHPKVAQAILRHSQISMTMDVYTHVVGDSEREAVGMLAELREDPLIG